MIFVWLVLPHIKTLTIIRRKTIRLCVCNCLWVTSSAKYSPPAFLNVFFFPLQYVHQMPVSVVSYWVMIVQSGASWVLSEFCIFPAKLGQWKISDSALSGKKRRSLNWKQGQDHAPWSFIMDASMPCLWWKKRSPWLLHFRDSFLTISSLSRYCLNFCLHLSCLPALNTWHVVLLFKY